MNSEGNGARSGSEIFSSATVQPTGGTISAKWVGAAALICVLALAVGYFSRASKRTQERDSYGTQLVFSTLQLSESTSLAGGKSTFVDGLVKNTGSETVIGTSLQVAFNNDEALPAQTIDIPLTLVRTHEPYVDTQPLAEAPLLPGAEREFRLIFEGVGANWNQQLPRIRVRRVWLSCEKTCP